MLIPYSFVLKEDGCKLFNKGQLCLNVFHIFFCLLQEFGCHKSHHQGCNIFAGDCVCDTVRACHSPYVYDTERECRKDIHSKNKQLLLH